MQDRLIATARACLEGAEANIMTFPEIVQTLMQAGFESYRIDFRRAVATYYLPNGDSVEIPAHKIDVSIAAAFDVPSLKEFIAEAQQLAPGYTYEGFCKKAASAGCCGYIVSFSGRRALYIGRGAETHLEHFPD